MPSVAPSTLVAIFVAGFTLCVFAAEDKQAVVERELSRIGAPPGTLRHPIDTSHRTGTALVVQTFSGTLTFPQVRSFYDAALSAEGWRFVAERPLKDWWRDLGGRLVTYCKGQYIADVQYAGARAKYSWDFGLSITTAKGTECGV